MYSASGMEACRSRPRDRGVQHDHEEKSPPYADHKSSRSWKRGVPTCLGFMITETLHAYSVLFFRDHEL